MQWSPRMREVEKGEKGRKEIPRVDGWKTVGEIPRSPDVGYLVEPPTSRDISDLASRADAVTQGHITPRQQTNHTIIASGAVVRS
jgi:hypothetical protein